MCLVYTTLIKRCQTKREDKMQKERCKEHLGIRVPTSLKKTIEDTAIRNGLSSTQVVKMILEDYFKSERTLKIKI